MPTIVINEPVEKTEHISYFVRERNGKLDLVEVIKCYYAQPRAESYASVPVTECRVITSVHKDNSKAAPLILMLANQRTVEQIFDK